MKEDHLVKSGLVCRFQSLPQKKGASVVHQAHPRKTKDRSDPYYLAKKREKNVNFGVSDATETHIPVSIPFANNGCRVKI